MSNSVVILALTAFFWLLLPASDSTKAASPAKPAVKQQMESPVNKAVVGAVDKTEFKSELDPLLLELPIMIGRPAPCIRNYRIGGN